MSIQETGSSYVAMGGDSAQKMENRKFGQTKEGRTREGIIGRMEKWGRKKDGEKRRRRVGVLLQALK